MDIAIFILGVRKVRLVSRQSLIGTCWPSSGAHNMAPSGDETLTHRSRPPGAMCAIGCDD